MATVAPAAAGIRLELQEILRSLSERIRAESAGSVADVRKRARLAEVGATRSLCSLCARFLTGRRDDTDAAYSSFLSPGQIRDVLDSALLDARELKILREEAESALAALSQDRATQQLDKRCQTLLANLVEQETSVFSELQQREAADADAAVQALKTCVADMSGVLLDALCAARDAASDNERRALGEEALAKVEKAAGGWASWFIATERLAAARTPQSYHSHRNSPGLWQEMPICAT